MKKSMLLRGLVWAVAILAPTSLLFFLRLSWPHTTHIRTTIEISRPPVEVFDYVTTPGHWPKWHPSSLAVHGTVDHSLLVGEQVTEEFRVAGRLGTAVWIVIDRQQNHRWTISGIVAGGGTGVVSYTVSPSATGFTHFERDFEYSFRQLYLVLLDKIEIKDRVNAESTEALARLKSVLESK